MDQVYADDLASGLGIAEERYRLLRRAKISATGLLAASVAVLALAHVVPGPPLALGFVRAAAEAAIVGGLADWFAVTALFKQPLGLPIPHTALIRRRKDEIGVSLGRFVGEQFLAAELLIPRLRQRNLAATLAQWLERDDISQFIGQRLAAFLPLALKGADDLELRRFVGAIARDGLQRIDLITTVDHIVDGLVQSGDIMVIADAVLGLVEPTLEGLKEPIIDRISGHTGPLFPRLLDRKIGAELICGLTIWLAAARTPDTEERARLNAWLIRNIAELRTHADYFDLVARAQAALASHPAVLGALGAVWSEVKKELLQDPAATAARIEKLTVELAHTIGRLLRDDITIQQQLNGTIEKVVISLITPWRREIGNYIAGIIAEWDADQVAEIIELQVGRDLQYIRINGTLVGALIGCALFVTTSMIPMIVGIFAGGRWLP